MKKIVILSTVHPALDHRVFHKEARSFAAAGYETVIIARADGGGDIDGVKIIPFQHVTGARLTRMTKGLVGILRQALHEKGDAYHLHDPELLLVGIALKAFGYRVVYDAHESLPGTIETKYWIPNALRRPMSTIAGRLEGLLARMLDGVIVANPDQATPFPPNKTLAVQNFPTLSEYVARPHTPFSEREKCAVYVGRLTRRRGLMEMIDAAALVTDPDFKLYLGGLFVPESIRQQAMKRPGWRRVKYLGVLGREDLTELYNRSRIGLVIMHPTGNHLTNQPVKLFEHMLAGIPSIASNFSNYRKYVSDVGAGISVDPSKSKETAEAIQWLLDHPEQAEEMGARGQRAVLERFNWEHEAENMIEFYEKTIFGKATSS